MDRTIRAKLDLLQTTDKQRRYKAFTDLIKVTNRRVPWAEDAWDELLALMKQGDNHQRAIGAQLLANLAKSDRKGRMVGDIKRLFKVTRDEMFVTARHSLLCLWKVGAVGGRLEKIVVDQLAKRFRECVTEKNCTLVRYDIQTVLRRLYDDVRNEKIRTRALALIETEEDAKYRKKYAGAWRTA